MVCGIGECDKPVLGCLLFTDCCGSVKSKFTCDVDCPSTVVGGLIVSSCSVKSRSTF